MVDLAQRNSSSVKLAQADTHLTDINGSISFDENHAVVDVVDVGVVPVVVVVLVVVGVVVVVVLAPAEPGATPADVISRQVPPKATTPAPTVELLRPLVNRYRGWP